MSCTRALPQLGLATVSETRSFFDSDLDDSDNESHHDSDNESHHETLTQNMIADSSLVADYDERLFARASQVSISICTLSCNILYITVRQTSAFYAGVCLWP